MPNAILNGISIDYTTAGEGPPVLLICGTGQPADLWFAQVADLVAAGHRVITFDNRGCGRSAAPPAPYQVADMAADTAALIEHLGLGPCDVIGYSLGGYIAQQLAVTCPALSGGSCSSPASAQHRPTRWRAPGPPSTSPSPLTRSRPVSTSLTCCYRCITSPCLAMAFEHDCWFPPRVVREAAQRMAGCQYVELSGLGHGAPLLAPREVNTVLVKFLD
jgi:pimeloyl-ACP methyl ester carboxylesterase